MFIKKSFIGIENKSIGIDNDRKSDSILFNFNNGFSISIIYGKFTYSESEIVNDFLIGTKVEIAIFREDNWQTRTFFKKFYNEDIFDDVKGYVSIEELSEILFKISKLKNKDLELETNELETNELETNELESD